MASRHRCNGVPTATPDSRANPQSLYLPVVIDPEYHYEMRNVEVQHANTHSLLWWTRRILDLRKQHPTFGNGNFEPLASNNSKVFAFIRESDEETLLVVANLSRLSQFIELDLSRYSGQTPTEMFGRTSFPKIGDEPYRLTLGPYGFFWFCLDCGRDAENDDTAYKLPTLYFRRDFDELLKGRARQILGRTLEPYLYRQRWFAGKDRTLQSVDVADYFAIDVLRSDSRMYLLLVNAHYADGEPETYNVPVVLLNEDEAAKLLIEHPFAGILHLESADHKVHTLCEATWEPRFWSQFLAAVEHSSRLHGRHGSITATQTAAFSNLANGFDFDVVPTVHGGQQNNTSASFDEKLILKLFRRLSPGVNPELEIGRRLTEQHQLTIVPHVAGALEYRTLTGQQITLAVMHQFVPNAGDAWTYTLDELDRYFERVQSIAIHEFDGRKADTNERMQPDLHIADQSLLEMSRLEPSELAQQMIGGFLSWAELLGRRVGELHVALAHLDPDPAFVAEPFTRLYQRGLYQSDASQQFDNGITQIATD